MKVENKKDIEEIKAFAEEFMPYFRMWTGRGKVKFVQGGKTGTPVAAKTVSAALRKLMPTSRKKTVPAEVCIDGIGSFKAVASKKKGRLAGKIAIVTGSAQGFGEGIAFRMVEEGAYMVIADMNYALAEIKAEEINRKFGRGTAIAVAVNVADEESVKNMCRETVLAFGGLDIFVNNAGVLKAGGLEEMTKKDFEFVTNIDYTAYFTCTKYASAVMKLQRAADPEYMADIIQINSKSGLEGSNKNFAYAGAKFGGIGLTQSFAKELAPYGIKVNSICPGNYLDGPLWSDPERGLFVQYLHAGKVPGAKNVEDVRKFYTSKVPLGRGCLPSDVALAIFYCVEQQYETGQAIPVAGGQVMLS